MWDFEEEPLTKEQEIELAWEEHGPRNYRQTWVDTCGCGCCQGYIVPVAVEIDLAWAERQSTIHRR